MGIAEITDHWDAALAALAWQVDSGVDEVLGEDPVNRFDQPAEPARQPAPAPAAPVPVAAAPVLAMAPAAAALAAAKAAAQAAHSLEALREAITTFDHCELKKGARNTVFADGPAAARVMVIAEAPNRDEDLEGRLFVGPIGQLLDKMFAAIGLSRSSPDADAGLYLTNVLPWRVMDAPVPADIAMMRPFVERHIQLADPQVVILLGSTPLACLTGQTSILRARGTWVECCGKPTLPMLHPSQLLRSPEAKRDAWADLLSLQARLRG